MIMLLQYENYDKYVMLEPNLLILEALVFMKVMFILIVKVPQSI